MKKIRRTLGLSIVLALVACGALAGQASAASQPAIVGSVNNASSLSGVTSVATSGNFAYAASYWSGQLNVIDISNPASPTLVASTPSNAAMIGATNVTISGSDAFVTSKNQNGTCTPGPIPSCSTGSNDNGNGNSLTIVDISNPASPSVVGTLHDTSNLFGAYAVAVSGNFAYVASQGLLNGQPNTPDTSTGSFSIIDLTNPASPTIAGSILNSSLSGADANALEHATSVAISGNFAYVTSYYGSRLTTINISNPADPSVVASLADQTNLLHPNDVAIQGNYAYVVNQVSGAMELAVVNLSNPAAPTVVAAIKDDALLAGSYRIRINGDFAYISGNGASTVAAVDISNPSAPRIAGSITSPGLANVDGISITPSGRYLMTTAPNLSTETTPAYPLYPLSGGPTNTGTVSVIDLEPSPLSMTIAQSSEPANPSTQTSANFTFAPSDAVTHVECSLDGAPLGACATPTTATYSSLAVGPHQFTVQATDATGATAQASYSWTIANPSPPPKGTSAPKVTSAPKISGTAQQGRTLTTSNGVWSGLPAPTFHYQWERCNSKGSACKPISKQTGRSYRVTAADVGTRLVVAVKASNSLGFASSSSAATKAVKWSAAAFATARLTGAKTSHPGVQVSVPSPGANLKLRQLVIGLPSGSSLVKLRRLAGGISVRDLHGKRLTVKMRLSHGKLTLIFKKPPTGVKVKIASGFVTVSAALHRKIKTSKPSEKLSLTLNYSGKPARRGTIKLRLS
jgi:hypothetical protein